MLSNLEADVLLAVEGRPEVESVWRLPPVRNRPATFLGESKPALVRVALASFQGAVHVIGVPNAERGQWVFGELVPPLAERLVLDPESRERAVLRRERYRAGERWALVPETQQAPVHVRAPEEPAEYSALEVLENAEPAPAAPFPREDGSTLTDGNCLVVAVVTRDESLVDCVRRAATSNIRVVELASGWELVEREHPRFHRVFWGPAEEKAEDETQLLRLVAKERPDLLRVSYFLVAMERWRRACQRHPKVAHRLVQACAYDVARSIRDTADPAARYYALPERD